MAKNKKASSKKVVAKAKKAPAKTKKPAAKKLAPKKAVKKAVPKKSAAKKVVAKKVRAKKVTTKKAVAKKASPKKAVAPKKVVAKKIVAPKKVKEVPPKKIEKAEVKKAKKEVVAKAPAPEVKKPAPPQLNIFPILNQRPIAHKPANPPSAKDERSRYSENELKEFEVLIHTKLDTAREEYRVLKEALNRHNDEGTDATSGGNTKVLEDGAETAEKENLSQLAGRQQKFIQNLENALIRIKNGTYGICSVTGKLIPKERLIAVPHTTQSIEAKMMQKD